MKPKQLLKYFDIAPKRSLGQNFLSDPGVLQRIVKVAALAPGDVVLEVGPGTGTLTRHLAQAAGRVVAVELDARLIPILRRQTADLPNVEIIHADILKTDLGALLGTETFHVVANLPYYITSAILRHLLDGHPRPRRLTLTMQREVAQRLVSKPGKMSLLAVSVQFYGQPKIMHKIKAGAFWPTPNVDSAVVRIDVYEQAPVSVDDAAQFFRVVKAGFSQKRKQVKNALAGPLGLEGALVTAALQEAGIATARRAETLSLAEWAALTAALAPQL